MYEKSPSQGMVTKILPVLPQVISSGKFTVPPSGAPIGKSTVLRAHALPLRTPESYPIVAGKNIRKLNLITSGSSFLTKLGNKCCSTLIFYFIIAN
jgi:hypothetical protein